MKISLHPKYCSFFPLLVKALSEVDGDVLELGMGTGSTLFLHWMCFEQGRKLVSYENHAQYYEMLASCESENHKLHLIKDWDKIDIEKPWGIAFVDQAPAAKRKDSVKRLANHAQVVIIHDSQGRSGKHYHYNEIYPLFKYLYCYNKALPYTTVLSNFIDVSKWGES